MNTLRHSARARIVAVGLATSGALLLAGCGAANEAAAPAAPGGGAAAKTLSGEISGVGSSAQGSAMEAWAAAFQKTNPDATVAYDPAGSGAGRTAFIAGGATSFAGSDAYFKDDAENPDPVEQELTAATERCGGNLIELPLYISPIAVIFNLEGVDSINLSAATIANIFNGAITDWSDPAITADNGTALAAGPITPVNRSDDSGTTENFTDYLSQAAPEAWTFEPDGVWPVAGGEAAQGTSGVVAAVEGGAGTIGYADASRAGKLGVVQVGVGDAFVGPTPEAAAAVLEASTRVEGRGEFSFAYDLARDTTEAGTYPVVLVAYTSACGTYEDAEQGALTAAFFNYIASAEGQEAATETAGNAPIPESLRTEIAPALAAINAG